LRKKFQARFQSEYKAGFKALNFQRLFMGMKHGVGGVMGRKGIEMKCSEYFDLREKK
jgi:hypothetical protein